MADTPDVRSRETGVAIVVWRRGANLEVLLLHRGYLGSGYEGDWAWTTPGGGRGREESPSEAAPRDLFEETGLLLECHAVESEIADRQQGSDVAVFAAEAPIGATIVLSAEHDRYEWVGVDDLSRCSPSWVQAMYREVLATLQLL